MVQDELGVGGLLLFELEITITFGTEVLGGWTSKESAVIDAETLCLASMFFRHFYPFDSFRIQQEITKISIKIKEYLNSIHHDRNEIDGKENLILT